MSVATTRRSGVEHIGENGQTLACIVQAAHLPGSTQFITPEDWDQQVGFVVYPAGGSIARHVHLPIERQLVGTSEVLVVRKGRCEVDLFDDRGLLVATRELRTGDVLILVSGGHGFRMLEDTVLLEVKQGPYTGLTEKEYF